VQLQVRVAEVSRNKLSEYSFSPAYQSSPGTGDYSNTGTGPYTLEKVELGNIFGSVANTLNLFVMGGNAFAFLRALQQQGALRALAEPNLIAMNGQTASFLAGGEIPVPLVTGGGGLNTVTIQWKQYGVRLNFKPVIIDEQHIKLELEPEVSTLDYSNAARLNGFLIPALRVRRAKTGIELQDGQSFGIAGLLDNNETKSLGKLPVSGDIPILGNLFKSKSFQRNETELVFIVTAKLSKPLNPDDVPRFKEVDGLRNGSPLGTEQPKADKSDKTDGDAGETSAPPAETAPAPATTPVVKPVGERAATAGKLAALPLFRFEKLQWIMLPKQYDTGTDHRNSSP
jgi:pilus assembly protein CpaC